MYKKARCTCKIVVLVIKPIAFLTLTPRSILGFIIFSCFVCRHLSLLLLTLCAYKIGKIFGPHTVPVKVTWRATPITVQHLAFSDYAICHSVKFKVKWVKLDGELQNILFLCNYQMFSPRPSPTLKNVIVHAKQIILEKPD